MRLVAPPSRASHPSTEAVACAPTPLLNRRRPPEIVVADLPLPRKPGLAPHVLAAVRPSATWGPNSFMHRAEGTNPRATRDGAALQRGGRRCGKPKSTAIGQWGLTDEACLSCLNFLNCLLGAISQNTVLALTMLKDSEGSVARALVQRLSRRRRLRSANPDPCRITA